MGLCCMVWARQLESNDLDALAWISVLEYDEDHEEFVMGLCWMIWERELESGGLDRLA